MAENHKGGQAILRNANYQEGSPKIAASAKSKGIDGDGSEVEGIGKSIAVSGTRRTNVVPAYDRG